MLTVLLEESLFTVLLWCSFGSDMAGKSLWASRAKAHRTLGVEASVFERRGSGNTRFYCSAQCAGFVPLGSSAHSNLCRLVSETRDTWNKVDPTFYA